MQQPRHQLGHVRTQPRLRRTESSHSDLSAKVSRTDLETDDMNSVSMNDVADHDHDVLIVRARLATTVDGCVRVVYDCFRLLHGQSYLQDVFEEDHEENVERSSRSIDNEVENDGKESEEADARINMDICTCVGSTRERELETGVDATELYEMFMFSEQTTTTVCLDLSAVIDGCDDVAPCRVELREDTSISVSGKFFNPRSEAAPTAQRNVLLVISKRAGETSGQILMYANGCRHPMACDLSDCDAQLSSVAFLRALHAAMSAHFGTPLIRLFLERDCSGLIAHYSGLRE